MLAAWNWSRTQFFVAASRRSVAIYRGVSQNLGPLDLSSVEEVSSDIPLVDLPQYWRERVEQSISADDLSQAHGIVQTLREKALVCRQLTHDRRSSVTPVTPTATPSAPRRRRGQPVAAGRHPRTPSPSSPVARPSARRRLTAAPRRPATVPGG